MAGQGPRAARRAELVDAAERMFAEQGVSNTAVSHIVGEAGVAQGTFYLYFDSKDDVLVAVAERMVGGVIRAAEAGLESDAPAAGQLRDFIAALGDFEEDPSRVELAQLLHRPENRLLHDRLEERLMPRLLPLVERIVEAGRAEGVFDVPDPRAAAWFVLGGLRGAELAGTPTEEIPAALETAAELALRTLGYDEPGAAATGRAGADSADGIP